MEIKFTNDVQYNQQYNILNDQTYFKYIYSEKNGIVGFQCT